MALPERAQTATRLPTQDPDPTFFSVYATIVDAAVRRCKKMRELNNSERASGAGTRRSAKMSTFGEWAPGEGSVSVFWFAYVKMCHVALQFLEKNRESGLY